MSRKSTRRIIYSGAPQNRAALALALIVMAALFAVVAVRAVYLTGKLEEYDAQIEELETEIAEEKERAEEIEEYAKYVQTDEYVEEVARDKLGLVREGEIIFRNDADADTVTAGSSYDSSSDTTSDTAAESAGGSSEEDAVSESSADSSKETEETDSADAELSADGEETAGSGTEENAAGTAAQ